MADVIAVLASPAASYVTGASWTVDGGMLQMAPWQAPTCAPTTGGADDASAMPDCVQGSASAGEYRGKAGVAPRGRQRDTAGQQEVGQ